MSSLRGHNNIKCERINVFSKIENRTNMFTLTSFVQYFSGDSTQHNKVKKKKYTLGKQGMKLNLFADDMALFPENLKVSSNK